jgi:hypothetical protein
MVLSVGIVIVLPRIYMCFRELHFENGTERCNVVLQANSNVRQVD